MKVSGRHTVELVFGGEADSNQTGGMHFERCGDRTMIDPRTLLRWQPRLGASHARAIGWGNQTPQYTPVSSYNGRLHQFPCKDHRP